MNNITGLNSESFLQLNELNTFGKTVKKQEHKRIVDNGWDVVLALGDRMIISETDNDIRRVAVAGEPWKMIRKDKGK